MNETHPYYLISEGFVNISLEEQPNGIGKMTVRNQNPQKFRLAAKEKDTGEIFLLNIETQEEVSISFLIDKGLIKVKGFGEEWKNS